jgi:predicted nucleotidyltransferase
MTLDMIDFPSVFTQEQIDYIGQCVVEAAREVCGDTLREVILFGSYARGDYKEWSDVDIMVLADVDELDANALVKRNIQLLELLDDLIFHMNLLLSVMITPYSRFTRLQKAYLYYRNVHREGKRLCSRQSS